ncbi:MAG: GNAT family N-acetyltransferase [bacterium]|nr:GNAT family N-acetyltransferase [bacterium]
MLQQVITTYLQMTDRTELQPARSPATPFHLVRVEIPCPEFNRFLYIAVGTNWFWYTRLSWDYDKWLAYLNRPQLETWVAYISGTPAGYFELEMQKQNDVEIAYFGILPGFLGKGLGGALLTSAITRAWDMGANRVWVHTCTLDHPHALQNYQARGFRIYRTEEKPEDLPDQALELWPGARVQDKNV